MEPIPRQLGSTALTNRTRPEGFFENYAKKDIHLPMRKGLKMYYEAHINTAILHADHAN